MIKDNYLVLLTMLNNNLVSELTDMTRENMVGDLYLKITNIINEEISEIMELNVINN